MKIGKILPHDKKKLFIGRLMWEDTVLAVKCSAKFSDFRQFRLEMESTLHFNSNRVRKIRASIIVKWFFPSHSLDNILTKIWVSYGDEQLLKEIMRYQFLVNQPMVAKFVVDCVLPLSPGESIDINYLRQFLLSEYGVVKRDPLNNLQWACRDLGFFIDEKNKLVLCQVPLPKTSLLILTHYLFAREVRTIAIKEIVQNHYWQFLGIREVEDVRRILHEADAEGIIAKYVKADQLEQITTRFSFEDFILNQIRL